MGIFCYACNSQLVAKNLIAAFKCNGDCGKWFHIQCTLLSDTLIKYYRYEGNKDNGDAWFCSTPCKSKLMNRGVGLAQSTSSSLNDDNASVTMSNITALFNEHLGQFKTKLNDFMDKILQQIETINDKIKKLENENQLMRDELKNTKSDQNADIIINEISDRERRSRNVLIFNLKESEHSNTIERINYDMNAFKRISSQILDIDPVKVVRLGKTSNKGTRPLKVTLPSRENVLALLRNKAKVIDNNIKLKADLTDLQRNELKKVY